MRRESWTEQFRTWKVTDMIDRLGRPGLYAAKINPSGALATDPNPNITPPAEANATNGRFIVKTRDGASDPTGIGVSIIAYASQFGGASGDIDLALWTLVRAGEGLSDQDEWFLIGNITVTAGQADYFATIAIGSSFNQFVVPQREVFIQVTANAGGVQRVGLELV